MFMPGSQKLITGLKKRIVRTHGFLTGCVRKRRGENIKTDTHSFWALKFSSEGNSSRNNYRSAVGVEKKNKLVSYNWNGIIKLIMVYQILVCNHHAYTWKWLLDIVFALISSWVKPSIIWMVFLIWPLRKLIAGTLCQEEWFHQL